MSNSTTVPPHDAVHAPYEIAEVGLDHPWVWLAKGWADMRAAPAVSFGYGMLVVVVGMGLTALLYLFGVFYLVLPLAAGFMLVAPILAVGLYEVSRRLERGEGVTMATPPQAWRHNLGQLAILGLVLMLFLLVWIRIATLIFVLFFPYTPLEFGGFMATVFFSWESVPFLLVGCSIGAVLAALVFGIAAISAPMLLDRDVGALTAIAVSVRAVHRNWKTMLVWAVLIGLFTAAGLVIFYIGLALTLPLVAHASWHAYRDLVVDKAQ